MAATIVCYNVSLKSALFSCQYAFSRFKPNPQQRPPFSATSPAQSPAFRRGGGGPAEIPKIPPSLFAAVGQSAAAALRQHFAGARAALRHQAGDCGKSGGDYLRRNWLGQNHAIAENLPRIGARGGQNKKARVPIDFRSTVNMIYMTYENIVIKMPMVFLMDER